MNDRLGQRQHDVDRLVRGRHPLTQLEQIMCEPAAELERRNRNLTVLLRAATCRAGTRWQGDDGNLAPWIQLGFERLHSALMPIDEGVSVANLIQRALPAARIFAITDTADPASWRQPDEGLDGPSPTRCPASSCCAHDRPRYS